MKSGNVTGQAAADEMVPDSFRIIDLDIPEEQDYEISNNNDKRTFSKNNNVSLSLPDLPLATGGMAGPSLDNTSQDRQQRPSHIQTNFTGMTNSPLTAYQPSPSTAANLDPLLALDRLQTEDQITTAIKLLIQKGAARGLHLQPFVHGVWIEEPVERWRVSNKPTRKSLDSVSSRVDSRQTMCDTVSSQGDLSNPYTSGYKSPQKRPRIVMDHQSAQLPFELPRGSYFQPNSIENSSKAYSSGLKPAYQHEYQPSAPLSSQYYDPSRANTPQVQAHFANSTRAITPLGTHYADPSRGSVTSTDHSRSTTPHYTDSYRSQSTPTNLLPNTVFQAPNAPPILPNRNYYSSN